MRNGFCLTVKHIIKRPVNSNNGLQAACNWVFNSALRLNCLMTANTCVKNAKFHCQPARVFQPLLAPQSPSFDSNEWQAHSNQTHSNAPLCLVTMHSPNPTIVAWFSCPSPVRAKKHPISRCAATRSHYATIAFAHVPPLGLYRWQCWTPAHQRPVNQFLPAQQSKGIHNWVSKLHQHGGIADGI